MAYVGGRPARVKGWGWGGTGGGERLGEQLLGRGGRGALNRGPQLGFHNDISGGQADLSVSRWGN